MVSTRRKKSATLLAILFTVGAVTPATSALAEAAPSEPLQIPHSWSGINKTITETFEVSGKWRLTLGAWCFDGLSWARVIAYNKDGDEVGRVRVIGEGVESVVLDTEAGEFFLDISWPDMYAYHWEVSVEPVAADEDESKDDYDNRER